MRRTSATWRSWARTTFPAVEENGTSVLDVTDAARRVPTGLHGPIWTGPAARQMVWLADVTDEARPMTVSGWTVRESSGNFCSKGRFGAHASNESFAPVFYRRLVFVSWFNAGVRVLDIRDPLRPVEVAHFVPAGKPLTNNVEVDERGYVYIVDRGSLGMHVLELAGKARKIANWDRGGASNPFPERRPP